MRTGGLRLIWSNPVLGSCLILLTCVYVVCVCVFVVIVC
jgi:hypothetical protein